MTSSRFLLAVVAVVVLGTATACCGGWQEPETIPFGVSADLAAVTSIDSCDAVECWLAVGSEGTVVWAHGYLPAQVIEFEVDSFDLGDADLTDAFTATSGWWVVGKDGTVAVSEDEGGAWQLVDSGTSANLHGIAQHADWLVAVGDEVIVVRQPDGSWAETPAPGGGWGQLRGIYSHEARVYAVGLDGIAWSADTAGEWVAEDIGVETDLFAVSGLRDDAPNRVAIVGAQGTLVTGNHDSGWGRIATGTTVDFVDVSHSRILAAQGEVFDYLGGELSSIDTLFPGATALQSIGRTIAVVGEGGRAQTLYRVRCGF